MLTPCQVELLQSPIHILGAECTFGLLKSVAAAAGAIFVAISPIVHQALFP
jgi:hypothetical protein